MFAFLYHIFNIAASFAFFIYGMLLALFGEIISKIAPAPVEHRPRLVIIGGGFAGALVAKRVERYFDTCLVDSKSYFEFTPVMMLCFENRARMC
jgi:hypothetical protein